MSLTCFFPPFIFLRKKIMQTVLIVEDEEDIADLVAFNLERAGYKVERATDGLQGLAEARRIVPDLMILDLMMPGMDGFALFNELRSESMTQNIPVIMLTARGQTEDKLQGLEMGVDDYVTKPFSPKELVLRVKNILKRTSRTESGAELRCGPFLFIKNSMQFYIDGEPCDLTVTEFKMMLFLCERKNVAQDRHEMLRKVLGYRGDVYSRPLDTHMKRLRPKLKSYSSLLETVRGVGYRIVIPEESAE